MYGDAAEVAGGGSFGTYNCIIKNNIIYGGSYTLYAMRIGNPSNQAARNLVTDYNLYYRDGRSAVIRWTDTNYSLSQYVANTTNGDNSIESNPLFVSAGSDFHLQSTSPAIDAGTASGAPAYDYDGNPRPNGSGYDIGAYESVNNSTPPPSTPPPPSTTPPPPSNARETRCAALPRVSRQRPASAVGRARERARAESDPLRLRGAHSLPPAPGPAR